MVYAQRAGIPKRRARDLEDLVNRPPASKIENSRPGIGRDGCGADAPRGVCRSNRERDGSVHCGEFLFSLTLAVETSLRLGAAAANGDGPRQPQGSGFRLFGLILAISSATA
jgi:hypothetical protein